MKSFEKVFETLEDYTSKNMVYFTCFLFFKKDKIRNKLKIDL